MDKDKWRWAVLEDTSWEGSVAGKERDIATTSEVPSKEMRSACQFFVVDSRNGL